MTREDKVNEFRRAGMKKTFTELMDADKELAIAEADMIQSCINEEFHEFNDAAYFYEENPCAETRANLCKEWADLQYVVSQAALFFDIPADASFNRVHNSNMTKVVEGKVIYRDDGKILKPDSYVAPDMKGL